MPLKARASKGILKSFLINLLLVISILLLVTAVFGTYRPEIVMTGSMKPVLNEGDIVIGKKVAPKESIRMGDIYTYKDPDVFGTITHRCIRCENMDGETVYVFKGDNNDTEDTVRVRRNWIRYRLIKY